MFQPHRFSRTELCWEEFRTCFKDCDHLIITDIYPAGEKPIPNVSAERLVQECAHSNAIYLAKNESLVDEVQKTLGNADVFVTLGAGDIWKTGEALVDD